MKRNPFLMYGMYGALATLATPAFAALPTYTDVELQARCNLIVNDNGFNVPPGTSFNSISANLNDDDQVAFTAGVVPIDGNLSHSGAGLWLGGHAKGEFVAIHDPGTDPEAFIGISDTPSINADGEVAYYTFGDDGGYRLWHYDPAVGESAAVSVLPMTPTSFANPVMTSDGRIGFKAGLGSNAYGVGITLATGGATAFAYDINADPASPYSFVYSPDTSDDGRIFVKLSVGDFDHNEIRAFDGLYHGTRVVANKAIDESSPFSAFDNGLAVSRNGRFVAVALKLSDGGTRAVYRFEADGEGGYAPVEIARVEPAGTIREIDFFAPAVNDDGVVAFRAKDANGQAIYVGDGEQLLRLIGNGDVVETDLGTGQLGQHDPSYPVFSGKPTINNHGDVAFVAGLYPEGNNQIEWGTGVFVVYTERPVDDDTIFRDGFDAETPGTRAD